MTRHHFEWWQDPPDGIDEAREDYWDRIAELRAERERLRAQDHATADWIDSQHGTHPEPEDKT